MSALDPTALRPLAKIELHVHLEGTFAPARVAELAAAAGEALPRPLDRLYDAEDLAGFLDTLDWVCSLVRDVWAARQVALDFGAYCRAQGIVYAEAIVNPTHWAGLATDELIEALAAGFDAVAAGGGPDVRLLPSILRTQTAEEAEALVDWIVDARPARVVGLSVDGNEAATGRTAERFAGAYARAGAVGLGRTAHAGESSGPAGVRDALDVLGVSRIDHGVRAAEDPALIRRLVEDGVTLNVCLSSNCALLYDDVADHPWPELVAAGVSTTVNTDDPEVLGVDLVGELGRAAALLNWGFEEVVAAQHRAIDAAFCDAADKARLRATLPPASEGETRNEPASEGETRNEPASEGETPNQPASEGETSNEV